MSGPEQKLGAWIVSLVFDSGKNVVRTCIAPSAEAASAIVTHGIMLDENLREETALVSVLSASLGEDWLRAAHRIVVEGGKPEGEVVRLVSDNIRVPDEAMARDFVEQAMRQRSHHFYGVVPGCRRCSECGIYEGAATESPVCLGRPPGAA